MPKGNDNISSSPQTRGVEQQLNLDSFAEDDLLLEMIFALDLETCLSWIGDRHELSKEVLFTPDRYKKTLLEPKWITQLVLMRLECIPSPIIHYFLSKKVPAFAGRTLESVEDYVSSIQTNVFSEVLKAKIRERAHERRGLASVIKDSDVRALLKSIKEKTTLEPEELFNEGVLFPFRSVFRPKHLLQAYLLRIMHPFSNQVIFDKLFTRRDVSHDADLTNVLRNLFWKIFTERARSKMIKRSRHSSL